MTQILSPTSYVNLYYVLIPIITLTIVCGAKKNSAEKIYLYLVWLISFLFMACRPMSGVFTDMPYYFYAFEYIESDAFVFSRDRGFFWYCLICKNIMSADMWFALTALIYTLGYFCLFQVLVSEKAVYLYLMLYSSFFFFAYGTNTIRAGMAAAILLFAIALYLKRHNISALMLAALSITIHGSMWMAICAIVISILYPKPKIYYCLWAICLIGSYYLGSTIENFLSPFFTFDERLEHYMTDTSEIGGIFRWDFVIYCSFPVFWSLFLFVKKNYKNKVYQFFVNIYLITNSIWLLLIRSSFTDRFAVTSWIFIPIIMIYPLLDKRCLIRDKFKLMYLFFCVNIGLTFYLHFK